MLAVKGIYDGRVARPTEKIEMPEDVPVVITFLVETPSQSDALKRREVLASLAGRWAGEPLTRSPSRGYEIRETLQ